VSFDSLSLKILTLEIKNEITGRTIDKIMQHRDGEFAFVLRNENGPSIMLISINPNFAAFFHTAEYKINFMNTPSNYQLLLKKHLEGARIKDIKTIHSDRILALYLSAKDSFSESEYILFFEFMGKHSNSFLYSGNCEIQNLSSEKVLGALNFSHNLCEFIKKPQKKDISEILRETDAGEAIENARNASTDTAADGIGAANPLPRAFPAKELIKRLNGLSPFLCKVAQTRPHQRALFEIARIFSSPDRASFKNLIETSRGDNNSIFNIYNTSIYSEKNAEGKIKKYAYPFDIPAAENSARGAGKETTADGESSSRETCGSVNECYARFYISRDSEFITAKLKDKISKLKDMAIRKKDSFESDLKESADYKKYSDYGHLIISALNDIKASGGNKKTESVTIGEIKIPLDARILISDNAHRYFKISKRLKAKNEYCKNIIFKLDNILARIEECRARLDIGHLTFSTEFCAAVEKDIISIAGELIYEKRTRKKFLCEFAGELKIFKSCVAKKESGEDRAKNKAAEGSAGETASKYYRLFTSEEGFLIYVGRSDTGNDYILSKIAGQQDYWLHVKDFRGPSVILKTPKNSDAEAIERAIEEAALYAVHFSQGRGATKIFVSCAMRKYVKKIKRAAGKVTYTNETTLLVDIDKLEKKFGAV